MKQFLLFIFCSLNAIAQSDTIIKPSTTPTTKTITYRLALSGTFSTQHNWYADENNYKSIAFLYNGDYSHRLNTPKFKHNYTFRSNLGYMKILDSIFIKNNDYWRINATLIENQDKRFTHTYCITARSQFLKTFKYVYDYETDAQVKKLKATFFNPATATFAYGLSYSFWEYSYINFNFAAVNFTTKPRFNEYLLKNDHELAKTKNMYMYADYGMNIQTNIVKDINPYTQWENYTYFFSNGINKQQVNLDFANRLTFKFLKYMQFRIDTHILYDPLYSGRLQYQHDFTLGFVYEKRLKK